MTKHKVSAATRRRMSLGQKRRHKALVLKAKVQVYDKEVAPIALHTTYLFGRVAATIDQYAAGQGISNATLARGVAELLLGTAGR